MFFFMWHNYSRYHSYWIIFFWPKFKRKYKKTNENANERHDRSVITDSVDWWCLNWANQFIKIGSLIKTTHFMKKTKYFYKYLYKFIEPAINFISCIFLALLKTIQHGILFSSYVFFSYIKMHYVLRFNQILNKSNEFFIFIFEMWFLNVGRIFVQWCGS